MNFLSDYFKKTIIFVKQIAEIFHEDRVSVYAAQATFFVIISTVPFISLVLSVAGFLIPDHKVSEIISSDISPEILDLIGHIIDDLKTAPSVSLLSISAIVTLWCASRGITAVRDGIGSVYSAKPGKNYFSHRLISLGFTLIFIIFILLLTLLILFGDFLTESFGGSLSDVILKLRIPFFVIALSIFFTGLFSFVAQRSDSVEHNAVFHIPGSVFSSVGWLAFSYFYSIYIEYFSSASYIYGGLTALCLIMLWLYFCMMILLAGSEINKIWFAGKGRFVFKKTDK